MVDAGAYIGVVLFRESTMHIHNSYSLNPLKEVIWGIIQATTGLIKGDARSLDNGSYMYTYV